MRRFLWGAATSSHQIEGGCTNNDWWAWEAEGNIEGGVRSGLATDHWNRFREDISLLAELGLTSYRFSIEWSRVEPSEGEWDDSALDRYREIIKECERHQVIPMVTLHHFTIPAWLANQGGFTHPEASEKFLRFVTRCMNAFGARVPLWCTINEPQVLIAGGYLGKFMPPAVCSPDLAARAIHQLLKAHALAYDLIHSYDQKREGPWADYPLMVGIAHNMMDFMPDRAWHPGERVLCYFIHRFYNIAWLDSVTGRKQKFGVPSLFPEIEPVAEALGRRTVDFIGVNYYTKGYVRWRRKEVSGLGVEELPVSLIMGQKGEPVSDLGWAIHPEGFRRVLRVAAAYGLPLYVTENGIADSEDRQRTEYLRSHVRVVAELARDGVDIRGYYHWSLLDNFEWIKGFKPRFGLYRVDYDTFERTPTHACEYLRKVASRVRNVEDLDLSL